MVQNVSLKFSWKQVTTDGPVRSKVVKICLNGKCKDIQIIRNNGFPVRCKVSVELSRDLRMAYPIHFIELYVPAEYGSLLEIGLPLTLTLDQTGS